MLKELFEEAFALWKNRTVDEKPKEGSPVFDHFRKKLEPAIAQVIADLEYKDFVTKDHQKPSFHTMRALTRMRVQ